MVNEVYNMIFHYYRDQEVEVESFATHDLAYQRARELVEEQMDDTSFMKDWSKDEFIEKINGILSVRGQEIRIEKNVFQPSPPKYIVGQHVLESGVTSDPEEYILVENKGEGYWKVEALNRYGVLHENDFRPMTGGEEEAYREEKIEKVVQSWIDANMQDCSIIASIIKYGVKGLDDMTDEELEKEFKQIPK